MKLKIKKLHPEAVIPKKATEDAAGIDLTAVSEKMELTSTGPIVTYGTGLAMQIPKNHVGLLFQRSSVTTKTTLSLGNAVGVIDSDYRGEVMLKFRNVAFQAGTKYNVGDRVGQLVILELPKYEIEEVNDLTDTKRGEGGFGSTDK